MIIPQIIFFVWLLTTINQELKLWFSGETGPLVVWTLRKKIPEETCKNGLSVANQDQIYKNK